MRTSSDLDHVLGLQRGIIRQLVYRNVATAGASTPASIIKEVKKTMSEEKIQGEGMENFAELVEQYTNTLNTGDKVTGVFFLEFSKKFPKFLCAGWSGTPPSGPNLLYLQGFRTMQASPPDQKIP